MYIFKSNRINLKCGICYLYFQNTMHCKQCNYLMCFDCYEKYIYKFRFSKCAHCRCDLKEYHFIDFELINKIAIFASILYIIGFLFTGRLFGAYIFINIVIGFFVLLILLAIVVNRFLTRHR